VIHVIPLSTNSVLTVTKTNVVQNVNLLNSYTIVVVLDLAQKDGSLTKLPENVFHVTLNVKPVLVGMIHVVIPVQMELISI
jgi:hypothetical protein